MKVRELMAQLGKLSPEAEVYLSSDGEGNSKRPVYEAEQCYAVSTYDDSIRLVNEKDDAFEVVVLWPEW